MFLTIIIVLASLILLMALHEFGHFLPAKKFGVQVDEFGVGYPPRIWGKKLGKTIYSINWLPFGAFVKILGEDGGSDSPDSFNKKSIWQRAIILLGGIIVFWLVAIVILTFVSGIWGVPTSIDDDFDTGDQIAQVKVFAVAADSPAEQAGIEIGDTILGLDKIRDIQELINNNLGKEVQLSILRGNQEPMDVFLTPRENPPENEGATGIVLVRVANLKTVWYKAPTQAIEITARQTKAIPATLYGALKQKLKGEAVVGVKFVGPIGVGQMMGQALGQGIGSYLILIAMISIWLALFNLLPIPALDGGRLLFLVVEGIRKKPIKPEVEQKTNTIFFFILIALMVLITVRDVVGLF